MDFAVLAQQGYNRVAVSEQVFADLDSPLSVYLKLANEPRTYLLESVHGGERFGRYSFIGLQTKQRIEVRGDSLQLIEGNQVIEAVKTQIPLRFIEQFVQNFKVYEDPDLPRFHGGLVGYFGYESVHFIEKKLNALPRHPDLINAPDILLMLSEDVAVFDNLSGRVTLLVYCDPQKEHSDARARKRLQYLKQKLLAPCAHPKNPGFNYQEATYETPKEVFVQKVERAKEYIYSGDVMQVVLSQQASVSCPTDALTVYRALRSINPSPYMFLLDFGDFQIIGSSPEILVRKEGAALTLRPLAGTRRRGKTLEEDLALEQELLQDEKERAEHSMLVDLGRNDLGRVAATGSVEVTEHMQVERYSHVMHIVSNVQASLENQQIGLEAILSATFPAGTVSGAPKVRAMEIIHELETVNRGVYAGAVGFVNFGGDIDLAIAIRTAVLSQGRLFVQAGAGIVADSQPEAEWQETQNKAKALLNAVQTASRGF